MQDKLLERIGVGEVRLEDGLVMAFLGLGGGDVEARARDIGRDAANVFAVGAAFLADPADRVRAGAPLDEPERSTVYGGGERGYADYPALSATIAAGAHAA